jgi:hypothetical protein
MMLSPALGRTPGRLGSGDVRDVLDTAFKQLGAPDKEHGRESTTDWEGKLGQLKASIAKGHRDLDLKLKSRYLYDADGLKSEAVSGAAAEGLRTLLTQVNKGEISAETAEGDITSLMANSFQSAYIQELQVQVRRWHAQYTDDVINVLDDAVSSIKLHESRTTGVKQAGQSVEARLRNKLMAEYRRDTGVIFAAAQRLHNTQEQQAGMKHAREKLRKGANRDYWRRATELSEDQLQELAKKSPLQKHLDVEIAEIADEIQLRTADLCKTALDVMGGGRYDQKQRSDDLSSLKKLKDAKLDRMDTEPDSRTASLIRTQAGLLIKNNIGELWALTAAGKTLTSSSLIGKDIYIIKNNDLVPLDGEDNQDFLRRMEKMGFGPASDDEDELVFGDHDVPELADELETADSDEESYAAATPKPGARPPAPSAPSSKVDGGSTGAEGMPKLTVDRAAERIQAIQRNVTSFINANTKLYTMLEQELKKAVDSAVEKSGNLFGDTVQDSRVNNAARGDGLSVIESWLFSAERFGDTAREAAHDFMRNGAGWLLQNNWKGGIETLRQGTLRAIDLDVEVTWAMTISRYMEQLYTHRPTIAQRLAEDYGKEPTDRSKNVIHDIPVFLGRCMKLLEAMTGGERKPKEGKVLKDQRVLMVARSQNFAHLVVGFDADKWDASDDYVANYTSTSTPRQDGEGGASVGKGGGKGKNNGKLPGLPANWKMWQPTGASYNKDGKRLCDNQGCDAELSNERYKMVVQKQQQSDLRGLERNKKKGLASWIHCDKCDQNIDAVVYPDGYMPGKRRQDKSKATPELIKRMEGTGPRANAAEVDSDDASSVAGSELSVLEETAQLTKARLEAQQAQIAAMEASAEAREKRIDEMAQQLESMSDAEQAHDVPQRSQRSVKGRGIGSYRSSRLRMDEDDDGGDE